MNGPAPTCREVLEQIYALIDCEECDRRGALIDGGDIDGPDARLRALMRGRGALGHGRSRSGARGAV